MACPVFHSVPAACSSHHILCLSCKACYIFEGIVFQLILPHYCWVVSSGVILHQLHLAPRMPSILLVVFVLFFLLSVISMTFDLPNCRSLVSSR